MHDIDVVSDGVAASAPWLAEAAGQALGALALEPCVVCVVLTSDAAMQALNAQWRGKDVPTDVLSFPQQDGFPSGGLLGDIVISVDTARAQAAALGHALDDELRVLLVHGLAHLLGHDHHTDADAAAMRAVEAQMLAVVGGGAGLVARAG